MLVLATNRPEDLDEAVGDRVDEQIEFPLPGNAVNGPKHSAPITVMLQIVHVSDTPRAHLHGTAPLAHDQSSKSGSDF